MRVRAVFSSSIRDTKTPQSSGRNRYNGYMRNCENCGVSIVRKNAQARYCSTRCRVTAHRATIPAELTRRNAWVRADRKRPLTITGNPASSTDASTWATWAQVKASKEGDGFGIMLGNGIGCYDLDHVSDAEARDLATEIPERIIYTERSMSGHGVHIFVEAPESAGSKKWQGRHERYTRERFIRMTGNTIHL